MEELVPTLLIAYDLNAPGQRYGELIEAIKALGAWWHHLDSTWLVVTTATATAVRDALLAHVDAGDELLIADVTGDGRAWYGFSDSGSAWLKDTWT